MVERGAAYIQTVHTQVRCRPLAFGRCRCFDPVSPLDASDPAAVRSVNDYVYIAQALGLLGRSNESFYALPAAVADASIEFFSNELLSQGTAWVRALSLEVRTPLVFHICKATFVRIILLLA